MGIKKLKKDNPDLDRSVLDVINDFDGTKTKKIVPLLVNIFKNKVNKEEWDDYFNSVVFNVINSKDGVSHTKSVLKDFINHLNGGRIENKDLTTYKDFETIEREVSKAEIKKQEKELAKETEVLYSDNTWLILKPLSLRSSLCYGSNTKWCVASKHNPDYFYNYSDRGIIIYVLNKVDGRKFGVFSSEDEFSIWDVLDRRIDSMEMRLPSSLVESLREWSDLKNPKNSELFTKEAIEEKLRLMEPMKKSYSELQPQAGMQPQIGRIDEETMARPADTAFGALETLDDLTTEHLTQDDNTQEVEVSFTADRWSDEPGF